MKYFFVFLLSLTLFAGCTSNRNAAPELLKSEQLGVKRDLSGRSVKDKIAEFAVNNSPGTRASVVRGNGELAEVIVGEDYISARNAKCRFVQIISQNRVLENNSVCLLNGVWQSIL